MKVKFLLVLMVFTLGSCVSQRKYNDMYALWVYADNQYQLLKQQRAVTAKQNSILLDEIALLKANIIRLQRDSIVLDSLYQACINVNEKDKDELERQKLQLQSASSRLSLSAAKVAELEALLFRKDSVLRATRDRLTNALIGFKDKGVNVHVVGAKVYISLDERLLFKSGQIDVNPAGKEALLEIAHALNQDASTILTVEGHTDDVPYKGKGKPFKDNWDISVLRATSVVRHLQTAGHINPTRFIAAGRAEFYPIDSMKTPEARRKNRRIEIIVTPNLDEIADLLNNGGN